MSSEIEWINLGFVNCYLIKTDGGFVLVDTGVPALRERLIQNLTAAGCDKTNLKLIIITHGDIDHTGNGKYLKDEYGALVAMHKGDLSMVENGDMDSDRKVTSGFMRFMHLVMRITGGSKKMARSFETFTPDIFLDDGDLLDKHGLDCKVVHIPGHTDGSIGLSFGNGDFICGDTLQNNKTAIIIKNEEDLRESVDKLSKLGMKMVYPGHGKPFFWSGIKK